MAVSMIGPKMYCWDRDGKPLAFGKVYTYKARTNAPKETYQSEDGAVENTNPVVLNGEGYANIYLDGSYKVVVKDKDDNEIWTADPVSASGGEEWVNCMTATYLSSTTFKITENVTDTFEVGRRVRIDNNAATYAYSTILSAVFAATDTTITITDPVVTTGLINACVSIIGSQSLAGGAKTISMLRSIEPETNGQQISLLGHTLAGIGGGEFYFDAGDTTSADDNGMVIVTASGKRWKRSNVRLVSPEMYGAGIGGNDTTGSQSAAAYSALNSVAFFPAKGAEYTIDSQLVFQQVVNKPVIICGNMALFKLSNTYSIAAANNSVLHIKPNGGAVLVQDVRIDGNNATLGYTTNTHEINGVSVQDTGKSASNVVIENIEVNDISANVVSALDCTDLIVRNCKGSLINFHGIFFKRCFNTVIEDNSLSGIGSAGGTTYGGIGILATACSKVVIKSNFITTFTDTGSKTEGCLDVVYSNNIVHDVGKDGIKVQNHPEQTEEPFRAIIENNIVKDLYPTRVDGSTCIQVSDTKYVTVTGNTVSNDFALTGSSRYGIRTFNHTSGTLGQAGFVLVNGNNIGNCAEDASPLESINVVGVAGGGHTQTINNNICYSGIKGGDGFGPVTINGNIVGAADSTANALALNGISSSSKSTIINGNTIRGFLIGVVVQAADPSDDEYSVVVSGNSLENVTLRQFDIGAASAVVGNMSVNISNNVCVNFVQTSDAAIRLRVTQANMDAVSLIGNTFVGFYRTLVEFNGYTTGVIGSYTVFGNVEDSNHGTYFRSNFVNKCKRVIGDYAQSSTAPLTDKSYLRGDIVYNPQAAAGLSVGYQCVNETTQAWLSIGTL